MCFLKRYMLWKTDTLKLHGIVQPYMWSIWLISPTNIFKDVESWAIMTRRKTINVHRLKLSLVGRNGNRERNRRMNGMESLFRFLLNELPRKKMVTVLCFSWFHYERSEWGTRIINRGRNQNEQVKRKSVNQESRENRRDRK